MTNPIDIDADLVRKLAGLLDETRLSEIEYAWGEFKVRVARHAAAVSAMQLAPVAESSAAAEAAPAAEDLTRHPGAVKSPMVGTAYVSAQPGAPPFVKLGDTVAVGATLMIIEAMKVMNQIRAPKAGTISRILVDDRGPVEFGQVLMLID